MKKILLFLSLFISSAAFSQNYPDYGLYKIRIADDEKTVVLEINPVNSNPAIKADKFYYWYSANLVHSTQGGYSGNLLNGLYEEFYLNKNIKQQGVYKKGLKDGIWKSWNTDGTTSKTHNWKSGVDITGVKPKFWKKINIFKKKEKAAVDSIAK